MASISASNVTTSSITCRVSGLVSGYTKSCTWRCGGSSGSSTVAAGQTTGTYSFSGLSPYTSYSISCSISWTDSEGEARGDSTGSLSVRTRPLDWAWTSTIAQGAKIQITAAEWNNFCARINQFRIFKGGGSWSFTAVNRGTPISAAIANEAREAITGISGHGVLPTEPKRGDKITAGFFNGLASALNSIT